MTVAMTCIGASPGWCRTTWTAVPRSHPPITSYLTITTPSTHTCATKVSPASRCVSPSSHPSRARAPRHLLHSNALWRTLPCASHRHLVHKNALRRMPIPPWLPGPDTPFFSPPYLCIEEHPAARMPVRTSPRDVVRLYSLLLPLKPS